MNRPRTHYWLPVGTMPAHFDNLWIGIDGTLYIGYRWRIVWLAIWRAWLDMLHTLAAWVALGMARGKFWRRGRVRQLELWREAA